MELSTTNTTNSSLASTHHHHQSPPRPPPPMHAYHQQQPMLHQQQQQRAHDHNGDSIDSTVKFRENDKFLSTTAARNGDDDDDGLPGVVYKTTVSGSDGMCRLMIIISNLYLCYSECTEQ